MIIKEIKNYFIFILPETLVERVYRLSKIREIERLKNIIKLIQSDIYSINVEEDMLKKIIRYSYENSEYYRNLFNKINLNIEDFTIEDLNKIELLDKEKIKKNNLKVKKFNKLKKLKINTGGTTGDPFEFYRSIEQGIIDKVCLKKLYEKMGYKDGDRIITFNGADIPVSRLKKNIFWNRKGINIPYGSIYFSSIYLNNINIKCYVEQLIQLKPDIIRGYPSFVYDISKYIIDNKINISLNVKGIQLTSEMSSIEQVRTIEKAFNTRVYFQYGHSEACIFAYAEEDMIYYCNPYYGYVEILKENGEHAKIGEIGEIVVTSYHNYVMPFIRYKTGDIAEYGGKKNGYIILNKLYGRTQDYIYNNQGEKYALTAVIFGQHLECFKNIIKWQIIQDNYSHIKLNIIRDLNYTNTDENEIRNHFEKLCNLKVEFNYINNIELTKSGKFRFLYQKLNGN